MKYDGSKMQLMVHGKDVTVRSVETVKEGLAVVLKVEALITEATAEHILKGWGAAGKGGTQAVFNAGNVRAAREYQLKKANQELEREIWALQKRLAQRAISELELVELDELD